MLANARISSYISHQLARILVSTLSTLTCELIARKYYAQTQACREITVSLRELAQINVQAPMT
jgi:hypothetical protein